MSFNLLRVSLATVPLFVAPALAAVYSKETKTNDDPAISAKSQPIASPDTPAWSKHVRHIAKRSSGFD